MPTIVGILTFISRINTSYESLKARNTYLFQHFAFYEQLKICVQLSWAWKKIITSGPILLRHFYVIFNTLYKISYMNTGLSWCAFSLYGKFHNFSVCMGNLRFLIHVLSMMFSSFNALGSFEGCFIAKKYSYSCKTFSLQGSMHKYTSMIFPHSEQKF